MSELDADLRARELAIDPARSILLQAPAGSGKTTVLTQRLLSLLCVVDEPEQILAITFTRKAAAEMRSRVVQALGVAASGNGEADATSLRLASSVLARSSARNWGLLEQPGRLRIQTIDSFNFWLASQLPIASRAGAELAVADRPPGGLPPCRAQHAAGGRCRSATRRRHRPAVRAARQPLGRIRKTARADARAARSLAALRARAGRR